MTRAALALGALVAVSAACGAAPAPPPPPPTVQLATPPSPPAPPAKRQRGDCVVIVDERTRLHPPPGDRALLGIAPTVCLDREDGTKIVGMGDGTVTALDAAKEPAWSVGLRGAVRGIAEVGEEEIVVTTDRGVMALLTGAGDRRWERRVTGEALGPPVVSAAGILAASRRAVFAVSPAGEVLFSHAAPRLPTKDGGPPPLSVSADGQVDAGGLRFRVTDPHPPAASQEPISLLTFRRVLEGRFTAVLAMGPGDLWALRHRGWVPPPDEWERGYHRFELVHLEGERVTRLPVPDRAQRKEVFLRGLQPEVGILVPTGLVPGPGHGPWILAHRHSLQGMCDGGCDAGPDAGQVLVVRGGKVEQEDGLFPVFFEHRTSRLPLAAARNAPLRLVCLGASQDTAACATPEGGSFPAPGIVRAVSRVGAEDWILTASGAIARFDGKTIGPVEGPPAAGPSDPSFTGKGLTGTGPRGAWLDRTEPATLYHHDGTRWTAVAAPVEGGPFAVRAEDDLYSGRIHWDGRALSLVLGMPHVDDLAAPAAGEVWVAGDGLWRGTAPGPVPVRLSPPPARAEGPLPAPAAAVLGDPETRYQVVRRVFAVRGSAPVAAAQGLAASPDGVLWISAGDRIVEVDGERASILRRDRHPIVGRSLCPEGPGRGTVILPADASEEDARDHLEHLGGGRTDEVIELDHRDAAAVSADALGTTWVARAVREDFVPAVLVRAPGGGGFHPVFGVPAAAYGDVSASLDGGAWLAGGSSPGPAGEGILFHARGSLGAGGTARYRAPATLLAVAAVGLDEAWAVGAGGIVVHVRAGEIRTWALPSGEWLRAVHARVPDDVWIGGDGGTLLHYDGRGFHPVPHPLGANASVTAIVVAAKTGAVWAGSPAGILELKKKP